MADELPNVVNLVVSSCIQSPSAEEGFDYTYTFSVSLPQGFPEPTFTSSILHTDFQLDEYAAPDSHKYALFISYQHEIPTEMPPGGFGSGYTNWLLTYTVNSTYEDITNGEITFMGSNLDSYGKKVRAKGSVPVTKSTP